MPDRLRPQAMMKGADEDALLACWRETVQRRGGDAAIFSTSGAVLRSFEEIEAEAVRFARERLHAFEPGAVIGIQLGNHRSWSAALLACLRRRLVALPMEQTMSSQEREAALVVCQAAALVTKDDGDENGIGIASRQSGKVEWRDRQPSLLKLTSGTTAAPRAIRFRSEQLVTDCVQICETMGISEHDLNFGVIPVSHSYGLSNLITPLLVRGVPLVLSRDRMPRAVLDDLARTNATVFPGMPLFYQAFCEMPEVPQLPRLRLCISAGAPLPLSVAQRFRERFGLAIHSFYGSSECGGICYDGEAPLVEQGFVGQPMAGVDLEMLDPNATSTRVRVHTAAAGDGYFPERDPDKLGGGSFAPDDLLTPTNGGFRIVG
ncbi:MAG TPA: class I adenylate-forming enzyme family protein, partial [Chthoniobacterales bacterium]|nr:class I adenylate-forming enzyme family protein [Chthoniobacterales bacterium]